MTGIPRGGVDYAHMNTEEDVELAVALNFNDKASGSMAACQVPEKKTISTR